MRENVKSKGAFYNNMAAEVEKLDHVGGPAIAKTARFLSTCTIAMFKNKISRLQYGVFEMALAMADVETAVALAKAAAKSGNDLQKAQSRIWAAEVAVEVPSRLLKLFSASGLVSAEDMKGFIAEADLPGAIALRASVINDMDFVAETITRD
jgi:hypothetical protein